MTLPDAGLLEALSLAELRDLVGVLIAEVRRVQSGNALLQDKVEAQQARIMTLQTENQALRDEVARFKGFEDILVRDLQLSAEVIRYRRERWLTPMGETVVAPLPTGIVGGFGP